MMDSWLGHLLWLFPRRATKLPRHPQNVLIIRATSIGDAVLTLPMIRELKQQTDAHITVLCGSDNHDIYANQPFIDHLEKINSSPLAFLRQLLHYRKKKFDLIIDTSQSSNITALFARLCAPCAVGFFHANTPSRNRIFDRSFPVTKDTHMVHHYFDLVRSLVKEPAKLTLVPLVASPQPSSSLPSRYAVLYARSTFAYKEWPIEKWIDVMKWIINEHSLPIVLLGSPSEKELNDELLNRLDKKLQSKVINQCGKTSIKDSIQIIAKSRFFIGGDGGLMHMAAAMNCPTVGLFGFETPERYGPFSKNGISLYHAKACRTDFKEPGYPYYKCLDPQCIASIEVKEVKTAVNRLVKKK